MKKFMITAAVFTMMIMVNMGAVQETEAGPFLKQGHWIQLGDGTEECMTHWWRNDCKVGDTSGGLGG